VSYFVEVAQLINGELVSTKVMSRRDEVRQGLAAAAFVLGVFLLAMGLATWGQMGAHRIIYGPGYLTMWIGSALLVTTLAVRRAVGRARRFTIGAGIDDDAFAALTLDLIQCGHGGASLTVVPGMTGVLSGGRSDTPIESLVGGRGTRIPLAPGARAQISIGSSTLVVSMTDRPLALTPFDRTHLKRMARPTLLAVQAAALISLFFGVPVGAALGERDMRSSIPATATPWEVEKAMRWQAQLQARSLHQCFDVLPMQCQRAGYVGVGVALSKSGEIRSNWISRSTYGRECPVDQCMADVVSKWFFEPVPENIKVVLPVQVLRTERAIPRVAHGARQASYRASLTE
jgi:hypothetical protein